MARDPSEPTSSRPVRRPATLRRAINRRTFLGALLGACASCGYATLVEPHWVAWTRREMPVRGLPAGLDGAILAHLSDLHAGPFVEESFLRAVFTRLRRHAPAYVVVTGDWVTWDGEVHVPRLRRALRHLPQGTHGTIGVLGNHDWGRGWRDAVYASTVTRTAEEAGVRVLRNEVAALGGLHFAGYDDLWSPGHDARTVHRAGPLPAATIGLCHNPDGADRPLWSGHRGWILSGHTHGGQCKPPFLPPPYLPVKNRRYTQGIFAVGEGRTLHVSRGVGNLLHLRFNARPEVTLFTLRPAPV
ncbi:MAG: metallophosphoesterase [Opitutaceae bacterium]|nr:metallophosphoesterase [Opitutaceae bacterium]